jgi:hypothetical protein
MIDEQTLILQRLLRRIDALIAERDKFRDEVAVLRARVDALEDLAADNHAETMRRNQIMLQALLEKSR